MARVDILERSVSEFVHPVLKSLIIFRSVITQSLTSWAVTKKVQGRMCTIPRRKNKM
jgi:hypothetical protein